MIDDSLNRHENIHFHTFSASSYAEFLNYFCEHFAPGVAVVETVVNDNEVIGILRKAKRCGAPF